MLDYGLSEEQLNTRIYEGTNQIQREEISKILIANHISGKAS